MKGKFYMMVLRPAIMYGFETVALTKREVVELEYKQEDVCGCSEGGHAKGWCDRGRCKG